MSKLSKNAIAAADSATLEARARELREQGATAPETVSARDAREYTLIQERLAAQGD
jgi:hypothetical protein